MMTQGYYDRELQRVLDSEYIDGYQVQINNTAGKRTKWLTLNIESIDSLRAFLDVVKDDMIRKGKI